MRLQAAVLLSALALAGLARPVRADDAVNFGIDWLAEAEYGGYYQAVATGIYKKHGLAVTIRQGGPSVNQQQLQLAGKLDFNIASDSFIALNLVSEKIPFRAVAAMFQKEPTVLIAHPGQGNDSLAALKGKPIMISASSRAGWWNFMKAKFGYTDAQIRPYNFNMQPFLADKTAVQQGYLGSEPFSIAQASGEQPVVMLIADGGFNGYSSLFVAADKLIATNPDLVQRFVDASIEGWYSYLHGDPAPANALIKRDNPEMTDALIAYGRKAMVDHAILESGDAATGGIGAMSAARWTGFRDAVAEQGIYPKDLDVAKAYTLQFVNKKTGMEPPK